MLLYNYLNLLSLNTTQKYASPYILYSIFTKGFIKDKVIITIKVRIASNWKVYINIYLYITPY